MGMKVNFLILGAQKGGSTWLYNNLQTHPHVFTPRHEIHFFSSNENYNKGIDWYHRQFEQRSAPVLFGEKTPEYLTIIPTANKKTNTQTCSRIFSYNKDMKLIVVLREPISRLQSAINHMYRTRRIAPWVTAHDLILGSHRDAAEAFSLIQNGMYYENLETYYHVFPKAQIKVLFFETDVIKRPSETLADVCSFLEIPFEHSFFSSLTEKKNEYQMSYPALILNYYAPFLRPINNRLNHFFPSFKAKIDSETRAFLQDYYRPSNEKLNSLVGSLPDRWVYR
jgi:hypothetical protein